MGDRRVGAGIFRGPCGRVRKRSYDRFWDGRSSTISLIIDLWVSDLKDLYTSNPRNLVGIANR